MRKRVCLTEAAVFGAVVMGLLLLTSDKGTFTDYFFDFRQALAIGVVCYFVVYCTGESLFYVSRFSPMAAFYFYALLVPCLGMLVEDMTGIAYSSRWDILIGGYIGLFLMSLERVLRDFAGSRMGSAIFAVVFVGFLFLASAEAVYFFLYHRMLSENAIFAIQGTSLQEMAEYLWQYVGVIKGLFILSGAAALGYRAYCISIKRQSTRERYGIIVYRKYCMSIKNQSLVGGTKSEMRFLPSVC